VTGVQTCALPIFTDRSRALADAMAPRIEAVYAALEAQVGTEFITRLYAALDELSARLDDGSPKL
jgi:hypothetical protein